MGVGDGSVDLGEGPLQVAVRLGGRRLAEAPPRQTVRHSVTGSRALTLTLPYTTGELHTRTLTHSLTQQTHGIPQKHTHIYTHVQYAPTPARRSAFRLHNPTALIQRPGMHHRLTHPPPSSTFHDRPQKASSNLTHTKHFFDFASPPFHSLIYPSRFIYLKPSSYSPV